ncbi:MAG: InlB B-repeat-containing protein [Ruminococcus sp.]|nr:InlB B-repeat-containing protein [Ruminococcus sp.]
MKNKRLFTLITAIIMMFSLCIILPVEVSVPFEASASGVDNIAARADYLYNTTWTAQTTVKGWRDKYTFSKGSTYHIPYGQPATEGKYICWGVSVDNFLSATKNASSYFYSTRSYYSGNSGSYSTYYAMDCSAFASYCWNLPNRTTTAGWSGLDVTSYGKCTSANVNKIQKGDALNYYGGPNANNHIVIVSDVSYDSSGNVTKIEITEQTPPEMKRSYYTASSLISKYSSYTIYRYNKRDSVTPPPDEPDPNPPTNVTLSKNQVWYDIKDIITLNATSDNATTYWISVLKDGTSVINTQISGELSFSAFDYGYGDYHAWVSAVNSAGSTDSNHVDFSIVGAATYTDIYTSQNYYSMNDLVSISVDTICAKGQVIGIDRIGDERVITEECESTYTIKANKLGIGKYSAYFSVYNGSGGVDTKRVEFSIYDKLISPTPIISTLSSSSLKLTWTADANATSYRIDRRKSGDDAYETIATTNDTTYTDTGLEENTKYWYRVYSVSGSDKSSEKNSVSGTTYILTSPTPTILTLSSSSLKLTWTADTNATSYRIDRRKSGADAYETIATTSDTTYIDTGLEENTKYWYRVYSVADYKSSEKNSVSGTTEKDVTNCNIKLYDNGQCLAESLVKSGTKLDEFLLPTMSKNGYEFEGWYTSENGGTKYSIGSTVPNTKELNLYARWKKSEIKGDINLDGKLNVSDAILLQKWLLGMSNIELANWKAADLCKDDRLDVFDMIEMRKLIINSQSAH